MLPALIFSGALLWYQRFEEYINGKLLVAAWVSTLAGMVLSLTRGAILSYLLSAPILLWRYSKRVFWIAVGIVTIILVSIFITISTMNYSSNSTARLFQPINSTSNTVRISQYLAAWHAFIENPLTGVGFRNFEKHSCKIKKKHQLSHQDWCGHAHNNLLELLAGAGILGFLFLLLFHIFWFMESLARQDIWGPLLATSVAGFFLSGLFQSTIIDGENMFVVMFLYGIGQVQTRWSKSTT
ncbi:MAG: O-antigen ligase family protein, partial [Bdellovibrionales bacterium]|nr:O-antigen ligase family protein [Bdellovibrionales bacterium]